MSVSTYIDPMGDTLPVGNVNPGGDDGPFVVLRLDGPGGHGHLSLGQLPVEGQAAYLRALQAVCGGLLTQLQQAALLAEVQATEHDPEAAAGIRASHADEAGVSS